ncbi:MAG TPA: MBL fold metallo-hydrolase [Candidatus Saccharimonadales bacterium]|nr:MBL fold metallo-hydrolase [Candidatus Saccharimonadales bacterium]
MIVYILLLIAVLIAAYLLLTMYAPFGARPNSRRKQAYQASRNFVKGKFVNQTPTTMHISATEMLSLVKDELGSHPDRRPHKALTPNHPTAAAIKPSDEAKITWFGHSAFMLQMKGKTMLLDPMFGKTASPFELIGPKRFTTGLPLNIDELPPIDAVIISHDHYDHLDYDTVHKLRYAVGHFFVPLGIGSHLERWGVLPERITELDWWQTAELDGIKLACTPSRHFSGRTLTDRFATLWASWVINDGTTNVFFSGDTGYGPHFKEIGNKYGPFDLTLLECGQYNERWPNIHMMPEMTAQAHLDLRGKQMIPMHWGSFVLALHDWTDPVERVLKAAAANGSIVLTPRLGEVVHLQDGSLPQTQWWKEYSHVPTKATPKPTLHRQAS